MRFLGILVCLLILSACKRGEVYDRTLDETRTVLLATEVPLHYFGPSADTDFSVSQPDPNTIVWKVTADGSQVLTYTAAIEPEGDHSTRVILTMEGAKDSSNFGDVAARLEKLRPIRELYIATMKEATDSALEARPFDTVRFYPQIASASMMAGQMMAREMDDKRPKSQ